MRLLSRGWFGGWRRRTRDDEASRRAGRTALRWASIYGALASLWILLSDTVLHSLIRDPDLAARAQQAKGLFFVAMTGLLVYVAVRRTARQLHVQQLELQATHERQAEAEGRWRHLLGNLDDVAWFSSADGGRALYVSNAVERVFGRKAQEFLDDPTLWRSLLHPDDVDGVREGLRQLHEHGVKQNEYRMRHAEGHWIWVRDRASVLRNAQGQVIGIGGISEDVTQRRQEQRALQLRERQLADIVDTAMDAIITIDAEQRVVLFNRAAEEVFGIEAARAIGSALDRFVPMRFREMHRAHIRRFAESSVTRRLMAERQPLVGLRANGEEFPMEASISKLATEQGLLLTVLLRDVSELRAAEAARDAQAAAEAASRAKTEFLSRMSHELRTPLNAILGFSQLLDGGDDPPLTPTQRAHVGHIHQAGWHLLALINDVLDVSRIEAGQLQVQPETVALIPLVGEVRRMCEGLADTHGVRQRPLPADTPPLQVRADRTRLRQVLLNLVSNGIKYNRHGGEVSVRLVREGGQTGFVVEDNGLGMTPDQLSHLFEPFNRLGRERAGVEGTGIGLTLTRELVQLMGGRIEVRSEPRAGTQVTVLLPDARHAAPDAGGPSPLAELRPGPDALEAPPQGLVLYIEDNPVNVLVVQEVLAAWRGLHLVPADDGRSGIAQARRLQPDLVLLDMRLPDMHGEAVLKALRSDPETQHLTVVALSASAMPEDVAAAYAAGAQEYWTKPLDFRRFASDVRRLLALRQADAAPHPQQ
jgi:PAS domain S-box-containing protein